MTKEICFTYFGAVLCLFFGTSYWTALWLCALVAISVVSILRLIQSNPLGIQGIVRHGLISLAAPILMFFCPHCFFPRRCTWVAVAEAICFPCCLWLLVISPPEEQRQFWVIRYYASLDIEPGACGSLS